MVPNGYFLPWEIRKTERDGKWEECSLGVSLDLMLCEGPRPKSCKGENKLLEQTSFRPPLPHDEPWSCRDGEQAHRGAPGALLWVTVWCSLGTGTVTHPLVGPRAGSLPTCWTGMLGPRWLPL